MFRTAFVQHPPSLIVDADPACMRRKREAQGSRTHGHPYQQPLYNDIFCYKCLRCIPCLRPPCVHLFLMPTVGADLPSCLSSRLVPKRSLASHSLPSFIPHHPRIVVEPHVCEIPSHHPTETSMTLVGEFTNSLTECSTLLIRELQ